MRRVTISYVNDHGGTIDFSRDLDDSVLAQIIGIMEDEGE